MIRQRALYVGVVITGIFLLGNAGASAQTYSSPTYSLPTYSSPTYSSPTYSAPTYSNPTTSSPSYQNSGGSACLALSQDLYSGLADTATGGIISQLQTFLTTQGYFTHTVTGTFGPITATAVEGLQRAQGIPATGYVGPLTRAAIKRISCGGTGAPTPAIPQIQTLSPAAGSVGTTVTILGSGFLSDNAIYFDNYPLVRVASGSGTTLTFVVPVSFGTTQVVPGQHSVFVQNAGGSSNVVTFFLTVNAPVATARPSIQGIDTPGVLYANQTGTWTVHVSIPSNYTGGLSLSVHWGDENLTPSNSSSYYSYGQSLSGPATTLTHVYIFSGNYSPTFTLSDQNGQVLASEATSIRIP
jgi:peptidoglycan hydrolase-like protein with peptidoglycan-binding domain